MLRDDDDIDDEGDVHIFRPLEFNNPAVVKIATEPLNPSVGMMRNRLL